MVVPLPLVPYVRSIVAYDLDMGAPGRHRGVPGTAPVLELAPTEPLDVRWEGAPASRHRAPSCVSGLHTSPADIRHGGRLRGVSVRLTLLGTRALLGVPAGELAGQLVDLDAVAPGLAHLPDALADGGRPAAPTVAGGLLVVLARRGDVDPAPALRDVFGGLARGSHVDRVARRTGWSRRHLQDLVRRECGLAPRDFRRLARLARSRDLLLRRGRAGRVVLADVATASGYADHAHLTRDWTSLAGCTPTTWLREELPFVQDAVVAGE
ncbi:helix-turn-helix domain-containing protein [Isoptericola halotolerans]|uniref:AraC family transcriptional regulator n=1 Tax=Isoptericola halotolerans TaxID=300560 RepID=UPI00388FC557